MSERATQTGSGRGSRRQVIAGVAGAAGALAARALVTAEPAQASQGSDVVLGADNTGATRRTGIFTTGNKEWAQLADPGNAGHGSLGVYGHGKDIGVYADCGSGGTAVIGQGTVGTSSVGVQGIGDIGAEGAGNPGVLGLGRGNTGIGVKGVGGGAGPGVLGQAFGGPATGGPAVHGQASGIGAAVLAENTFGYGPALQVHGPAAFSSCGIVTVAARKSSAKVQHVTLSSASLILATLQQNRAGVYVQSAVPDVSAGSFTVHLNKAVTASTKVAWFILNTPPAT